MPYSTLADMIDRYGEDDIARLSDRSNRQPAVIDVLIVERAIASADAEIDMHLQTRHTLPLPSVPLALIDMSCILAYANLNPRQDKDAPEMQHAARQRDMLKRIAEGKISLGLDSDSKEAPIADTVQIAEGRNDFGGDY